MADVRLGGAYVDVNLDFKKVPAQAKKAGKDVEAFFDKYSKESFFDKYSRRAEEAKANLFLPSDSALKDAVARKAAIVSGTKSGSIRAMMGAQLTYGLQDLLTGASMGNMNQALLGMSNNLSMIAMMWGGISGTITSIAVAALPLMYTGIKALLTEQDNSKEKEELLRAAVERTNDAFERRLKLLTQQAGMRKAGEPIEIGEITKAAAAESQIKSLATTIKQLEVDAAEVGRQRVVLAGQLGSVGEVVTPAGGIDIKTKNQRDAAALLKRRENELRVIKENPPKFGVLEFEKGRFQRQQEEAAQKRLDADRKRIAMDQGYDENHRAFLSASGKVDIIRMRTKEDQANLEKKNADLEKRSEEIALEITNAKTRSSELIKRRDEIVNREIRFSERSRQAGFNAYEQAKIRLDRQQEEAEIQINKDYGGIVLKPGKTKEERAKEIEALYEQNLSDAVKARREMEDFQAKRGRTLGLKRAKMVADIEAKALERRDRALAENEAKGGTKAVTAADTMLAGSREEFRRKRIELAEQFAGGKTGFAGIADLSKQIQTGMGGRGMTIPEQTTAIVKAQEKATTDLISFMTNTGIKIQGGGLR